MIGAQRVDFVSIQVRDMNPLTGGDWPEFETGNVTLALVAKVSRLNSMPAASSFARASRKATA